MNTMDNALTPLQRAYLLGRSDQLPLGGVAMQEFREYRGRIDLSALRARLAELTRRHACLRTRIDADALTQTVSADPVLNYEQVDLSHLSRTDALSHIDALREEFAHRHSNLHAGPWQVLAFALPPPSASEPDDDESAVVLLRFDGLCMDGRSIATLVVELFGPERAPTPDHVVTLHAPSHTSDTSAKDVDVAYWKEKLKTVTEPMRLPWAKPLESITRQRYERQSLRVSREQFALLSRVGARLHLFKNSTLMAITLDVLSRWLSEGSLCVGVPVAPQAEGPLGNASSFIAIHWNPQTGNLSERAKALQSDVLSGLERLSSAGVDLARLLMKAGAGSVPLPVVITNGLSWPVLDAARPVRLHAGLVQTPQVAMDVRLVRDSLGNLVIDIDYAREAIERARIADMLTAIERAIHVICTSGRLDFTARDVLDYSHYCLNSDDQAFVSSRFLARIADHLFGGRTPRTALICGERRISYAELGDNVSRAMAALSARGLGEGSVVALYLPRSPEQVAVTLACALLGVIWVPIDATSPDTRARALLSHCGPNLVVAREPVSGFATITPDTLLSQEAPADPLALAKGLDERSQSERAAYYLYTSGTTGKPKCVVLANRATSNVIGRSLEQWRITERDVLIAITPAHHDMSVFEVFGSLTASATLVLPGLGEERDAIRWNQLVAEHGVTVWSSVPAIFEMLLSCRRGDELKSLRHVMQGGDYIKPSVIAETRRVAPNARLHSVGGPTETTIWSIWHEIGPDDVEQIPYGHPLPANRYFVLNDRGEHCPVGVVGRMHTAGANVALGYRDDQGQLSQHDFPIIEDEHGNPARTFRASDCGRYREDGALLFAGRVAGYVKVRGVRISLPDVESVLVQHPQVQRALAIDVGSAQRGETTIGVLYVPEPDATISVASLRDFAKRHLPPSHIPGRFVAVKELPLSANGKPDRQRGRELLTSTDASDTTNAKSEAAPLSPTRSEQRLLDIYLGVLGKHAGPGIDSTTDFISLGLRPSHLKTIATRVHAEFGVTLAPQQLLRCRNANQVTVLLQPKPYNH